MSAVIKTLDDMKYSLYYYSAVVEDVYDGDSITVDIDLGFYTSLTKQKIRLYGINTPELRSINSLEKERAYAARDYVRDKILYKKVIIKTIKDKKGKYGRWLGVIYYLENPDSEIYTNLNLELIDEGYAKVYIL